MLAKKRERGRPQTRLGQFILPLRGKPKPRGIFVKSPEEMTSKEMLVHYQNLLDEEAREHKKNGKLVCWSSSVAPSEIFVNMDIALVYPETHAAGIGARKGALDMLEHSEQKGYSSDICSYARINLAYMDMLKEKALTGKTPEKLANSPAVDVPLPDVVVCCNNICNTLLKWYENLAYELNIPCIIIDVPYNHHMPVEEHRRKYIAAQIKDAIELLERLTSKSSTGTSSLKCRSRPSVPWPNGSAWPEWPPTSLPL